ncbi:hypothetical protein SIO70_15110 [Chitinophaga sancti]|uniref:hypothetical protein n=1 Tax=Chitinophaga sancti TaxID=1004 RepID=UPI002A74C07F|nr:hypothetical protein [Chitinophaga sancti]WPQ66187.1 hypothetical protein SIO70_15110 [Chitinophaga sancti]
MLHELKLSDNQVDYIITTARNHMTSELENRVTELAGSKEALKQVNEEIESLEMKYKK